ncbi:glycoside hydrolase family 65 protein [Coraliomargarita parva]|uniref:glycoside hydrolase family 65 protein n=1 Tax=Coraliomargarita parva TaxID=3014050 RepID=UPI0022B31538|nr:glycosyl hydrolase family 65 protein [Coraliomargarita parva]
MKLATPPTSTDWILSEDDFLPNHIEANGNKFLIGNGYMGLRGTLEEFGKEHLAACTLSGLYDQSGDKWREPVNAPHAYNLTLIVDGIELSTLKSELVQHSQQLDLANATHRRSTTYQLPSGKTIKLEINRFLSLDQKHLGVMQCRIEASEPCLVSVSSHISTDIWDINGPHLEAFKSDAMEGTLCLESHTVEKQITVVVASTIESSEELPFMCESATNMHLCEFKAEAGIEYSFCKYIATHTGVESHDPKAAAITTLETARSLGLDAIKESHDQAWKKRWTNSDVQIEGDEEAQNALRYSIYHLLIAAPENDHASIPARGLSGQVYKGAIFWDTEIFMLPFFDHTQPELARHLIQYRYHTLDGARRKAAENGFRGAFYAWESQETGDDACTFFNVTDVITGRPMRTYFRDKQIHISADVALAIWRHYQMTGDLSLLTEGGAEVILECARFFYSYASYKPERQRFELHDVVGPDEYHERVHNNAFTNAMVRASLQIALQITELLKAEEPQAYDTLIAKLSIAEELAGFEHMAANLYIPAPDKDTKIIEQFDGYFKLEDNRPESLKERLIHPNEYWGGGHGIATTTQVIKQADVVLMLHLFSEQYASEIKQANWEYYEPRTEHGSSLSPCVYALLAAELGKTEWAYKYFLRTATIDLTGKSKQFIGDLYIGGTHPAANGGAWMAAILGFAGLRTGGDTVQLNPQLPESWEQLSFRFAKLGQWFSVKITADQIEVTADATNAKAIEFDLSGDLLACEVGATIQTNR